jgi:hypothetical protein
MTQAILSALGSDQVNTIGETAESVQVAECLRQTYFNMLGRYDLPEHNELAQLVETNAATPTLMTVPLNCSRIEGNVRYFDTNPADSSDTGELFEHDLNTDLVSGTNWMGTVFLNAPTAMSTGPRTVTFIFDAASTVVPAIGQTAYMYATFSGNGGTAVPPGGTYMSGPITAATNNMNNTWTITFTSTITGGGGTFQGYTVTNFQTQAVFGPGYLQVQMIPIDDFFDMVNRFDPNQSDVGTYQLVVPQAAYVVPPGLNQSFQINYKNSHQPQYSCVLSNNWVIFDAFDNTQDTYLRAAKTEVYNWTIPAWTMSDTFEPLLDPQHFPLFLADAKALAFFELKQMPHQKAEDEVARQLVSLQKWKAISGKPTYFDELPNFGRRGGGMSQVSRFGPYSYIHI